MVSISTNNRKQQRKKKKISPHTNISTVIIKRLSLLCLFFTFFTFFFSLFLHFFCFRFSQNLPKVTELYGYQQKSTTTLLAWLDTAVVCVLRRFLEASSRFHSHPWPIDPKPPPVSCVSFTTSRYSSGKDLSNT